MSIWIATSVDSVPEIALRDWCVFEVEGECWEGVTRHFVGYNVTEHEGRVSSAIVEWDVVKRRGVTASGRVYQLIDDPGFNSDAQYVWSKWKTLNLITAERIIEMEDEFRGDLGERAD
jgi:hypothetical protein